MPNGRIPQEVVVYGLKGLGQVYEDSRSMLAHGAGSFDKHSLAPYCLFGTSPRTCILATSHVLRVPTILLWLTRFIVDSQRIGEQAYQAMPPRQASAVDARSRYACAQVTCLTAQLDS